MSDSFFDNIDSNELVAVSSDMIPDKPLWIMTIRYVINEDRIRTAFIKRVEILFSSYEDKLSYKIKKLTDGKSIIIEVVSMDYLFTDYKELKLYLKIVHNDYCHSLSMVDNNDLHYDTSGDIIAYFFGHYVRACDMYLRPSNLCGLVNRTLLDKFVDKYINDETSVINAHDLDSFIFNNVEHNKLIIGCVNIVEDGKIHIPYGIKSNCMSIFEAIHNFPEYSISFMKSDEMKLKPKMIFRYEAKRFNGSTKRVISIQIGKRFKPKRIVSGYLYANLIIDSDAVASEFFNRFSLMKWSYLF